MIRVGIIGTRGIPNTYGGFERFVEVLVAHQSWRDSGVQFVVYGESPSDSFNAWTRLSCVGVAKNDKPMGYYMRSAAQAAEECDIVLCCGVGISFFAFWPRLRHKYLVVNPDGCEWRRSKWSSLGRLIIRLMYAPAILAANRVVIDAEALREDFGRILGSKARYIGYQAPEPRADDLSEQTAAQLGLKRPFMLVIARLEPENSIGTIVNAFVQSRNPAVDLILVGSTSTRYYQEHLAKWHKDNVRFLGAIFNQQVLGELRSNCLAYIHGHTVGGTNPSLLEALATVRGQMVCHDNKYNREVAGEEAVYFQDESDLAEMLRTAGTVTHGTPSARLPSRDPRFHPDTIAERYQQLFTSLGK